MTPTKNEPSEIKVDVPPLTDEEKVAELTRCSLDPWYWIINYVYISDPVKGKILFEAWPHMESVVRATQQYDRIIILKARQIGVSWVYAALALWYARFRPNSTVVVISKDGTASTRFKWRCAYVNRNMPDWMQYEVGKNNDTEFEFPVNDSRILSFAAGEEAGRSESASVVILDEWAFQEYARTIYTAILPTVEHGKLIGISTANGKGNLFYDIWRKASLKLNSFTPLFIKYNVRPGRDLKWWKATERDAESPGKHRQEYPITIADAFAVIQEPYFDIDSLNNMPVRKGKKFGDYSTIYQAPDENETYGAGIDPAPGGGDGAICQILNSSGDQVAICKTNQGLDGFIDEAHKLLSMYGFPFLINEKQGEGTAVLRSFTNTVDTKGEERRPYPKSRIYKTSEKNLGWHTGSSNRGLILAELRTAIRTGESMIYDADTLEEFSGFGENPKTGKLEGLYGHDDCVLSYAMAFEALKHVAKPVSAEGAAGRDYATWGKDISEDIPPSLWEKRNPFECYERILKRADYPLERCGINHNSYKEMLECAHNQ